VSPQPETARSPFGPNRRGRPGWHRFIRQVRNQEGRFLVLIKPLAVKAASNAEVSHHIPGTLRLDRIGEDVRGDSTAERIT
jgi:hypothetical protein